MLYEVSKLRLRLITGLLHIVRDLGSIVLVLILRTLPLGNITGDIEKVLFQEAKVDVEALVKESFDTLYTVHLNEREKREEFEF